MADNLAVTQGTGTTIHTDEKTISSALAHVQRVTVAAGDNATFKTTSATTTPAVAVAANNSRIYVQIIARDGDLYLATSNANAGSATTRRTIQAGEAWESQHYLGAVSVAAVTGTVNYEVEEIS